MTKNYGSFIKVCKLDDYFRGILCLCGLSQRADIMAVGMRVKVVRQVMLQGEGYRAQIINVWFKNISQNQVKNDCAISGIM